MYVLSLNRL